MLIYPSIDATAAKEVKNVTWEFGFGKYLYCYGMEKKLR